MQKTIISLQIVITLLLLTLLGVYLSQINKENFTSAQIARIQEISYQQIEKNPQLVINSLKHYGMNKVLDLALKSAHKKDGVMQKIISMGSKTLFNKDPLIKHKKY
jgi:hypothetical protein